MKKMPQKEYHILVGTSLAALIALVLLAKMPLGLALICSYLIVIQKLMEFQIVEKVEKDEDA